MKRVGRQPDGFTLVEMLVVLVLVSLLALGLVSTMQTMGRTQDRLEQRFAELDERQVVRAFVAQILGRLSDRRMVPLQPGQPPYAFHGDSAMVQWLGIMPARPGLGGRYWMRVELGRDDGGMPALMLRYQPWAGETTWPDWSRARSRILVAAVSRFEIAYGGGDMPPSEWLPGWDEYQQYLPTRLSLRVDTMEAGQWPMWVIATRALSAGGARASMYSTGPGR
ncbi:prepilin-type N-terminal cleavage/methylation domain-containing protein [Comamonas flocculans]|uniref:prepilin-type N-terminal cleavage/methylation domain-containing protein n=1 Tax=Comamonas flocculans TaxID=2597701 RepID=UPI0016443D69|nr:prepilin-type N-terminal cleavage/methylation domain-containing protein [Comamonas flocculans]